MKFKKLRNIKFIKIFLTVLLSINYSLPLRAETILEKIEKTGLLKVGIRSDAIPFGYRDNNNELRGICFDFVALLREKLTQEINREIITVNVLISTLYNRFEIVDDDLVYLECGPNTIRDVPEYNITFSQPFFLTGTQLLIKKELFEKAGKKNNLADFKLGVLRFTTTEEFIKTQYPNAEVELFQGVTGSLRAIQAVQQGRIDAFANDGILLIGESILLDLPLNEEYTLIPENPLTCEKYGLILPENDPSWQSFVNSVVKSSEDESILKDWLSILSEELRKTQKHCLSPRS